MKRIKPNTITEVCLLMDTLDKVKEPVHIIGGCSLLRSLPGCGVQKNHTDYAVGNKKGTFSGIGAPYVGLVALENNTTLNIEGKVVCIPLGACLIMRGNVIHAGSAYNVDNIRFHFYMDTDMYVARNGRHTEWK